MAHLFPRIESELLSLLGSLSPAEWQMPTVSPAWSVKDIASHLLDGNLRRLSMARDGFYAEAPRAGESLAAFINRINAEGVQTLRRLSPRLLIHLLDITGREMSAYFQSLDPYAPAVWAVSWAGEEQSVNWFDIARDFTEKWHHQQQIRDATGRSPPYEGYLAPVIDTFARALPFAYRDVAAAEETAVVLRVDDAAWSVVREGSWQLFADEAPNATTRVTLSGDRAWRLFTRQRIDPQAVIEGDARYAEPLLRMVSIV